MSARDVWYGRQGGRVVAWDDGPIDIWRGPVCDVCDGPLVLDQPGRHWACTSECPGCHRPVGPKGQNCECKRRSEEEVVRVVEPDAPADPLW